MKDMISLAEAVNLICQRTGKSRKQAARELLEKLRSGELRAWRSGPHPPAKGKRREFWQNDELQ